MHKISNLSLGKTCEKGAKRLVTSSGQSSTDTYTIGLYTQTIRVQLASFAHFIRPFATRLSTSLKPRPAPVFETVFRTFHYTYNNHHKLKIEER